MELKLDTKGLQQLLRSFHDICNVRIGIFDRDAHPLFVYPQEECMFCRFIKSDPCFHSRCIQNDREAISRAMNGQLLVYFCHAGLCEAVIPILCDNRPIACLMIGQAAPVCTPEQAENKLRICLEGHPMLDKILACFHTMPQRSERELEACAQIMSACAGYIYLNAWIAPQKTDLATRLNTYIREQYVNSPTLSEMADALGVSVTQLCTQVRAASGTTPHALLNEYRMQQAKQLLVQTDLPIRDIAEQIGISDYNYFSRIFRKTVGQTPSAFRKNKK